MDSQKVIPLHLGQAQSRMVMADSAKKVGEVIKGVGAIAARHNGPVAFGLIAIYGQPGDDKTRFLQAIESAMPKLEDTYNGADQQSGHQGVLPLAE